MTFRDRNDAGQQLADRLKEEAYEDPLVLALPRGGVPVAAQVAAALNAPLEVFVARKVGAPGQPEFGIGAIAEDGGEIVVTGAGERLGIGDEQMRRLADNERAELSRRVKAYRGSQPLPDVRGHDVVLIDDGLATGVTAEAALRALRRRRPRRLVLAAPVCPPDTFQRLSDLADDVISLETPPDLGGIGAWYDDFSQTSDDEVVSILHTYRSQHGGNGQAEPADREVTLAVPEAGSITGDLVVPGQAHGVVLFAHGSGSGRHSPRNRSVAEALHRHGLATFLMDLLTEPEEREDIATATHRFDIGLLAHRLELASTWLAEEPTTAHLPLGLFGASTGAAAALTTAAHLPGRIAAVVSRGGRPDLAGDLLTQVQAPTLLIVGELDHQVRQLNESARDQMSCPRDLRVVPGATHLFEEPGALDEVANLAGNWFTTHLEGDR